jgi:hypothetical protein
MATTLLTPTTPATVAHVFETAGLGQAPYKFLGIRKVTFQACYGAPVQPGACCMFCSTGIVYQFWLRSADNKTFFVGSDCIYKSGDAGLKSIIDPHVKAHEAEMRRERENHFISEFKAFTERVDYWKRTELTGQPHPNSYWASTGKTLADYQFFCYSHAGQSAKAKMARRILIAEGLMKAYDRCAKRITEAVQNGVIPEGAIILAKTLFRVIPDGGDDIFTVTATGFVKVGV